MPAQLVALTEGTNILLDKAILLIGRHQECDIQIHSRKVSRLHCCIAQVGDYLVVRDLGSTNGIRVNGTRVLEGRLHVGDELTIGNFRYLVRWDNVQARAPHRREPAREPAIPAAALESNDDDSLESHDEPVPLRDLHPIHEEPAPPTDRSHFEPKSDDSSLHIPDDINLRDQSDLFDAPPSET